MKTQILTDTGLKVYDQEMKNFIDRKLEDKVDMETGKGLSTNDYNDEEKNTVAQNKEDIENIKRQMESYETENEDIVNTTESTLENSYEGGLVINEMYGKTEQNAYTGKNLLDCSGLSETTSNGVTFTPVYDANGSLECINVNGTATAQASYYIGKAFVKANEKYLGKGGNSVYTENYFIYLNGGKYIYKNDKEIVYTEDKNISAQIVVLSGVTVNNDKFYPMISLEGGEYEPYVGGTPSPSPSYPQEIKSVKGKNLLDCRGLTEQTTNGITFTPVYDENGNLLYINTNGTASANAAFEVKPNLTNTVIDKANSYILSGCPNGGSDTTYRMVYTELDASWGGTGVLNKDYGAGVLLNHTDKVKYSSIRIDIFSGTVCDNLKFYPMIRPASITDATYVPYGLLRIKTHGKNLLELTLDSKTSQGVLFSVDKENGTVTATGKATGYGQYAFEIDAATLKGKTIILSGTPSATSGSMALIIDGTSTRLYAGDNGKTISVPSTCNQIIFQIAFEADEEAKNDVFKPMIRLASITDDTYEPYQENSITLSEPIELNGFNGVYDVVTSDGVTRRFAEVVFDGSSDENWGFYENNGVGWLINQDLISTEKIPTTQDIVPNVLCSMAKVVSRNDLLNSKDSFAVSINGNLNIYNDYTSADDWRAFLQSNPMTVIYELATPVVEELPTTDKIALKSIETFDKVTYVTVDSLLNPIIDVNYATNKASALALENTNTNDIQDIKISNIIDNIDDINNEIAEISKDIINTTETVLEKSKEGGLLINEIQGKTEQKSYTGKNLLECRKLTERTINEITYTPVYENGLLQYINVNGTATEQSTYPLLDAKLENDTEKQLYVTGCYEGGSSTFNICTGYYDENGTWKYESYNTNGNMPVDKNYAKYDLCILVRKGITVNNVKFYPMVSVEGGEYEPYVGGKPSPSPDYPQEIKSVKGKNLLDCRGLVETTNNGVKFTPVYDNNGNLLYVNVNGTASDIAAFRLDKVQALKEGKYILSGCPSGGSDSTYRIRATRGLYGQDTGNGVTSNLTVGENLYVYIEIANGYTTNNLKFYPMIREASIIDNTYVPYGLLRFKTQGINQFDISAPTRENEILNPDGTFSTNSGFNSYRLKLTDTITISYEKDVNFDVFRYGLEIDGVITRYTISGTELTIQKDSADAVWISIAKTNAQKNIMINSGTIALPYQPYQSSEITLSEPIELNGFNGVYDVLTSDGVTRRFGVAVLDGTESYRMYNKCIACNVIDTLVKPADSNYTIPRILCEKFIPDTPSNVLNGVNVNTITVAVVKDTFRLRFHSDIFSSVEDAISYFSTNPTSIVYELATSTTEELQSVDQIALHSIKTFDETTYIETDSEIQPIFDVDYGCSQVGATALENHNNIEINRIIASSIGSNNRITYTLTKENGKIILTGSDGSTSSVDYSDVITQTYIQSTQPSTTVNGSIWIE